jgi:hypothetical protein
VRERVLQRPRTSAGCSTRSAWSVPKSGIPSTSISSLTIPRDELPKTTIFTGSSWSATVRSSPSSIPSPPSPDIEITWRPGWANWAPIACGSAFAIDRAERADHAPPAVGGEVSRRPDVVHAGVDGEGRVVGGDLVEDAAGVLGMDRQALLDVVGVGVDHPLEGVCVLAQHAVEKRPGPASARRAAAPCAASCPRRRGRRARAACDGPAAPRRIDLDRARLGQEVVVGEVGADQDEQPRIVHRLVAGAVPEPAAHADVVRFSYWSHSLPRSE